MKRLEQKDLMHIKGGYREQIRIIVSECEPLNRALLLTRMKNNFISMLYDVSIKPYVMQKDKLNTICCFINQFNCDCVENEDAYSFYRYLIAPVYDTMSTMNKEILNEIGNIILKNG